MAGQGHLFRLICCLGNSRSLLTHRTSAIFQQQNLGLKKDTKELLKNLNVPERPKKPLTPYFRFLNEHRPLVQKDHPDWKVTQLVKQCAEDWKNTHQEIKGRYTTDYKEELEAYAKKYLEYNANLSDEQKSIFKEARKEKLESKKKREMKKRNKETGKPKRPPGAFFYFAKDKYKDSKKSVLELNAELKIHWQNLPESEKERFKQMYIDEKRKYDAEMEKWEKKMIEQGNTDLVRSSALIEKKPSHIIKNKKKHLE